MIRAFQTRLVFIYMHYVLHVHVRDARRRYSSYNCTRGESKSTPPCPRPYKHRLGVTWCVRVRACEYEEILPGCLVQGGFRVPVIGMHMPTHTAPAPSTSGVFCGPDAHMHAQCTRTAHILQQVQSRAITQRARAPRRAPLGLWPWPGRGLALWDPEAPPVPALHAHGKCAPGSSPGSGASRRKGRLGDEKNKSPCGAAVRASGF